MDDASKKTHLAAEPTAATGSLSRLDLGLILLAATLPRLFGLHHVSLWLDEILSSLRVGRSLPEAWLAWKDNRVHPPLSEMMQWLWFRVVESEPMRRLLPITLGVLTVIVLARLADRWFGRRVALATGWIAAFSPLHVRYSQELRAYSLGLLALVLALAACHLALERRNWTGWAILGLSIALCFWSLYTVAIVLAPIGLATLQASKRSTLWPDLTGLAFALVLAAAMFSPWFAVVRDAAVKVHEQEATDWTAELIATRWQFLTVGGVEGDPLTPGAMLFGVLVGLGCLVAIGSAHGRSILVGALAGTFGMEVVLQLANHWSNGRYNLAAWPFLIVLAALGCTLLRKAIEWLWLLGARAPGRPITMLGTTVTILPLGLLLWFETAGLANYFERGRPDWQSVARAVADLAGPDRAIAVSDEWARLSLGYYLAQLEGAPGAAVSTRPRVLGTQSELAALSGSRCALLVDSKWTTPGWVEQALLETPAQLGFPRSGARVAAIPTSSDAAHSDPWSCLPHTVEAAAKERPVPWQPRRLQTWKNNETKLEMVATDQLRLPFGWSYPEQTSAGMTFRWALGRWAGVKLASHPAETLEVAVWTLYKDQILTVYHRHRLLATLPLETSHQTFTVPLPDDFGASASESLTFGFANYAGPRENPRPLAVSFDRIALVP